MNRTEPEASSKRRRLPLVFISICLVSALYFADIALRASVKCFWADELTTVFLCRLPDLHSISVAVLHGTDANPPLFYWLTWGSEHLFGEGVITARLPAIVGFYLFCLCLYFFVSKTMGRLAGFVAGVFPFFTMAQYYAYEARPHGITLGWCGLALICWQRAKAGPRRYLYLLGFCLSLTGGLLTHVYAAFILIPFVIAELYETWRTRQFDWGPPVAMALAVVPAIVAYIPLLRGYAAGGASSTQSISLNVLQTFLLSLTGPAIIVLLATIVLIGIAVMRPGKSAAESSDVPPRELVLALAFASLPIMGILSVKLTHGPFFFRYFLSSIAGFAIFLGAASNVVSRKSRRMALCLPVLMLLLMVYDLRTAAKIRTQPERGIIEPTSGYIIGSPKDPLARDGALLSMKGNEDVLVLEQLNAAYLINYAPPAIASRLYIAGVTENDPTVLVYKQVSKWTPAKLKVTTFAPFFATHDHFFVYGSSKGAASPPCGNCEQEFLSAGYTLKSEQHDIDGVLYEYSK